MLLRGVAKKDVQRGQVLAKPGSITAHTKFRGEARCTPPPPNTAPRPGAFLIPGCQYQFWFRTVDCTGAVTLPDGVELVKPGGTSVISVELTYPLALEKGLCFTIREGGEEDGKPIATGQVTEIL